MTMLSLSLLGPFQASLGAEPLTDFRTRKVQALLVFLAVQPEAHQRDLLLNLFWPGLPEKSARSNLRQVLYYLRQSIPETAGDGQPDWSVVIANRQEIQLDPRLQIAVDTRQFEALLQSTQAHKHMDLFLCRECAAELEQAVNLYRGDFLTDFYLDDSNEFEEWAHARREYFRRKNLDALETLTTMALRAADYGAAQTYAERQLDIDNLRESAYRQLMESLALSGRREQALAVYDNCRRVLAEELGMAPTTRTTEYYQTILAGDLQFDRSSMQGVRGYELKEPIGEGAYGIIYRAVQPAIHREVAMKVIRRKYADDPEFIRRFESEAQIVARLEHPYIVPLYDYWRDPQGAYLAMRYMRGGSLLNELKAGPWDAARAAGMLEQIAGALTIAHQQGVIHRDIKPGNILLDEAGNAYLADFGIAKDQAREQQLTADGALVGTLDYVSPEQIMSDAVTPQSDIYSLGAVLYETLTGEKPFSDASIARLLYSHLHDPIPLVAATRPDIPPEIDTVLQKATAKQPAARYATVMEMAVAFRRVVSGAEPATDGREPEVLPALAEIYNPYKGLQAFQEADTEDFFGRETLVQQLVNRLAATGDGRENRFLAVVGPSGSGKSSVVKAGLIPALRQSALPGSEKWFITEMTPGANPLEELELALWRVAVDPPPDLVGPMKRDTGGILRTIRRVLPGEATPQQAGPHLLLVIDQFEELFTLVEDPAQRAFFLDSLLEALEAPRSPLRLVITLRADFYDRPLQYPAWGQLMKEHTEIVLPLNKTELTWAVREPARRMGVRLEAGLAATIVTDIAEQPGALPLLQYAMTELFEQREDRLIAQAAYEKLGGVQGALGKRAEAVYAELDEAGQHAARQLFLRLVTLGEGAEDTRRRVLRSELETLAGAGPSVETALDRFGRARFLTFDRDPLSRAPTVEVAHEALLREWSRLHAWLAESRDDVRLQRLLAQAAGEWHAAGRDIGYLLRGARLDQFAGWAQTTSVALTARESDFVAAGVAAREKRLAVEEERRQRELQAARDLAETQQRRAEEQDASAQRLRRRALYLAGALVIAALLAVAAVAAGRQSGINADLAATREVEALANAELAASREAEAVANAALAATREVEAVNSAQQAAEHQAEAEAEADLRATAEAVAVAERQTAEEQARLATSRELALSSQANLDRDPELSIVLALQALETAHTKQAEEALHHALQSSRTLAAFPGWGAAYTSDGARLATMGDYGVKTWDADSFEELETMALFGEGISFEHMASRERLLLSPQGERAATVLIAANLQTILVSIWDTVTGDPISQHSLPGPEFTWSEVSLSPDLSLLAVGHEDGTVDFWDVESEEQLLTFPGHDEWAWDVRFSPDGRLLLVSTDEGETELWDVEASLAAGEGVASASFTAGGDTSDMLFSEDGSHILVSLQDDLAEIWDINDTSLPALTFEGSAVAATLDSSLIAGGTTSSPLVTIYDGKSGQLLFTLAGHADPVGSRVRFSPDGTRLASSDGNDVRIWDVRPASGGEYQTFIGADIAFDLELSRDGRLLALGNVSGPASISEASTGELLHELSGEPDTGVYSVSFSPDGSRLATAGEDGHVRVWDVETGELLLEFLAHIGGDSGGFFFGTLDVEYSPDGRWLATAGANALAKVWDAETGVELAVFDGHTDGLHSVAISPDGSMVATGSDVRDGSVRVWDPATGEEIHVLEGHSGRIWGLAFSLDSRILLTGGSNGEVMAWDMVSGERLYTLPDQGGTVTEIVMSPDGGFFATGAGTVGLWVTESGEEIVTLATGGLGRADFSPDGKKLYARAGNIVRVLAVALEDTIALAQERLTRGLTDEECRQYLHVEECPPE